MKEQKTSGEEARSTMSLGGRLFLLGVIESIPTRDGHLRAVFSSHHEAAVLRLLLFCCILPEKMNMVDVLCVCVSSFVGRWIDSRLQDEAELWLE